MARGESSSDTCRICCSQKRSLRSLFQKVASNTYADLIKFLTGIQIKENDGYSDKICKICRGKAEEAYDFVQMVIRVHRELCGSDLTSPRKYKFDDINNIKEEFDAIRTDNICEDIKLPISYDYTFYNDVSIKKIKTEPEEITFEDFVNDNDIDYDVGNQDNDEIDDDCFDEKPSKDKDYIPNKCKPKNPPVKRAIGRPRKLPPEIEVDLEPKVMEELREKPYQHSQTVLVPIKLPLVRAVKSIPKVRKRTTKKKEKLVETICPYCGKLCRTLNIHLLTHTGERSFKCTQCPRSYFTAAQLKNHMITHTGEKKFKCDKCNMKFYHSTLLKSHMSTHKDVRDHICDVCSKSFKRKSTLSKHMMRHNSANKTIKCELCNMTFFEKFNLAHHMRIHTGERPFKCELCSQPYSYKPDFNRHCFKKHGVYMKRRNIRVMTQEVLEQERIDVKALFDRSVTVSLPTPITEFPCVIDEAQIKRLYGDTQ